jgi:hypothetical protein
MKKPLSLSRRGSFETIIQQNSAIKKLVKHIRCHSLTDCLDILENLGHTGDTAIFILVNLQYSMREVSDRNGEVEA